MREIWRLERRECAGQEVVTAMFLLRNANAADADVRRDMTAAADRLLALNPPFDTQTRG